MNLCRLTISKLLLHFSVDFGKIGYPKKIPMNKFAGLCDYRTTPLEGVKQ